MYVCGSVDAKHTTTHSNGHSSVLCSRCTEMNEVLEAPVTLWKIRIERLGENRK